MNKKHKSPEDEIWNDLYPRIILLIKKDRWELESVGAVFGFGGAIFSFIAAIILATVAWSLSPAGIYQNFKVASFICFALNLPLLALGAHCLDLLEKKLPYLREIKSEAQVCNSETNLPQKREKYAVRRT